MFISSCLILESLITTPRKWTYFSSFLLTLPLSGDKIGLKQVHFWILFKFLFIGGIILKKTKRILSVFLAAIMVISALPFSVTASAETTLNVGDVIEFGRYNRSGIKNENDEITGFVSEPIKWRVLNVIDGKALVFSDEIIDAKKYNSTSATVDGYYGNNYAQSDIRKWLINDFYNSAFTFSEKNMILSTTLDNSACATDYNASGSYTKYSSESTTDKVFLLSKDEANKYASKYFNAVGTDYAYENGYKLYSGAGSTVGARWLLRTAGNNTFQIYYVHMRWGKLTTYFNWDDDSITAKMGVRPAMYIDIDAYIRNANNEITIPDDAIEYNGHSYSLISEILSWNQAKEYCERVGGHLATITSAAENNAITSMLSAKDSAYWIGAECTNGEWKWITDETWEFTNWGKGEPAFMDKDHLCARVNCETTFSIEMRGYEFNYGDWDACQHFDAYKHTIPMGGFICEWEPEKDKLSGEATDYIVQHLAFIQSGLFKHYIGNYGFYDEFWQYEEVDRNFTAYAAWEVIGDIGEVVTLKFDELFVTDNPYDVILADVLSNIITNSNMDYSTDKRLDNAFSANSLYKDFLSLLQSSEKWNDSILNDDLVEFLSCLTTDTKESLINGVFFSPSKTNLKQDYPAVYDKLKELLPSVKGANWNKLFKGLDNFSVITDYISTGADVVETIISAYQKYVIAKALVTTQEDVLKSLEDAAYRMTGDAKKQLLKSISSYREVLNYDNAFSAVSNYMVGGSFVNVYNLFKGSLTNLTYTGIAKMFGLASVSAVNSVIVAYNVTYALLDKLSGVGAAADIFFILNASALLENALVDVANSRAEKMTSNNSLDDLENVNSLDDVVAFDATYGLLQAIEQYCYKGFSTYISAMKQQFVFEAGIKSIGGNFIAKYFAMKELNEKKSTADRAIAVAVSFEGSWRNSNCHYKNIEEAKLVAVRCPTDVYVYDESEELVLAVVDNKVVSQTANIAVIVDGSEKIFALPDIGKYLIKVVGTDDGTMTYSVYDTESVNAVKFTEYSNMKLSKNCVYNGIIDSEEENDANYELTLTYCEHSGGTATCISQAICDNCLQPYGEFDSLNHVGETEIKNKIEATCTTEGNTGDIYCRNCKNVITIGESIKKTSHIDENNDYSCDNCGEKIKQDVDTNCNHICHTDNKFLKFIWTIFNFFMKLFSMERICTCGAAHY